MASNPSINPLMSYEARPDDSLRPPSEKSDTLSQASRDLGLQNAMQQASQDPTKSIINSPKTSDLLNRFHVFCIIANRMIGTGIFDGATTILREDQNVGWTLVLWTVGAVASFAGALMYIEYGLTIPRVFIQGRERSVPRSGGELNYLAYLSSRCRYLAACVFGWVFILIGNSTANCISFAVHVLAAAGHTSPHYGLVQAIAIAVAWGVLLVHATGRMAGIHLNIFFALVKIAMLFMIIILGFIVLHNHVPRMKRDPLSYPNLDKETSFKDLGSDSGKHGYATAYLSIVFAYGGFNQANYVLGKISKPAKSFRLTVLCSVGVISILYIMVSIAYVIVVPLPRGQNFPDDFSVCGTFFTNTIGQVWDGPKALILMNVILAISSFGNVVVTTFTAARVKQEIAKEGVLPYSLFLSKNVNVGAIITKRFSRTSENLEDATDNLPEPIPLPALCLDGVFTTFLILGTFKISQSQDIYPFVVGLYSYTIDAMVAVLLSGGLMYMRLYAPSKWNQISLTNRWLSLSTATIVFVANLFPIFASLVPQWKPQLANSIQWYMVPVVGWAFVVSGVIYWIGFRYAVPVVLKGAELTVTRTPILLGDDEGDFVIEGELIKQSWEVPVGGHS